MTPCCGESLFEKGSGIPETAKDSYSLNDFGYLSDTRLQWKFVDGAEGPMAVYKFSQLWVSANGEFSQLPSKRKERFLDGVTHHPLSADGRYFIATTTEHVRGKWLGYILIYEHRDTWTLRHRITPNEYARPIQFVDETRVLVLHEHRLSLLDVADGQSQDILNVKSGIYSNAHVSDDGECVAAVAASGHQAKPTGIDMANLQHGETGKLKFGINRFYLKKPEWMANRTFPVRVHNGMVTLSTTIAR